MDICSVGLGYEVCNFVMNNAKPEASHPVLCAKTEHKKTALWGGLMIK